MVVLLVLVGFGLVMIALSVLANARYRQEPTLPMQWSLSGAVNWSAPRLVALSLVPVLAISVLILPMILQPRPGQDGEVTPTMLIVGSLFVAVQVLHLWLVEKTVRRKVT